MGTVCADAFKGMPESCLDGNGILMPSGLFFTQLSEQFDTLEEAGDESNWTTKAVDGNISYVHDILEVENMTGEDQVYESTSQKKKFLFPGVIGLKFSVNVTVDQHKTLLTYNNKKGRMGFYDKASNIIGSSNGTWFRGYTLGYIRVSDLVIPAGESPAFTTIEVQFANNLELNQQLHVIRPYKGTAANIWYPANLQHKSMVSVEQIGTVASNEVVFKVNVYAPSDTDNDGNAVAVGTIEGLDVATFLNFVFTDGAGAELTPTTMTEDSGEYTATFTAISAGSDVTIKATSDNIYESDILTFI